GCYDARGGQRAADLGEGGAFERAPGNGQQVERRTDVRHGFGADGVVREEARGELGDLGEGAADGVWIRAGGPGSHAGRAERARGVRPPPPPRGSKPDGPPTGRRAPSR